MNLIFFGTGSFAVPILRAMREHIRLVVTQPDRPSGRGMRLQFSEVKVAALEMGLEIAQPDRARSPEFVAQIQAMAPDALLVASYGQILSQTLLDSALRGGINLHGSILPKYRGAAPIQRCLMAGDSETGITLMQMDRGMDTGDIIEIRRTRIEAGETYGELQSRLAEIASQTAEEWMPKIAAGDYSHNAQPSDGVSLAPKLDRSESELHFDGPVEDEFNKYRGTTPSPGAYIRTSFGIVKILAAKPGTNFGEPGVVLGTKGGCEVAFGGGSIVFTEVQLEGKKRTSGQDFANGLRLKAGMSLVQTQ